jgi:PEP-CTERM motif
MKPTIRRSLTAILVSPLFLAPLHAAVIADITLTGGQNTTVWTNLKNTNVGLAAASGTGAATVQAPGYQAGVGLYSFSTSYSCTVTQAASFDMNTVVFQADLAPNPDFPIPFSGGPLLSFNGGSQNIAASYFQIQGSESRITSFGPQTYSGAAWQWDLSGYSEVINSVSIVQPFSVHTAVAGMRIDGGGTFTSVIPEPSAVGLAGLAAGLLAFRRQRRG